MTTPEDRTPDEFEEDPTRRESGAIVPEDRGPQPASERNTGTYSGSPEFVAGQESGYKVGFKAGVDRALAALRVDLLRAQCTEEEIARVVARIRAVTDADR